MGQLALEHTFTCIHDFTRMCGVDNHPCQQLLLVVWGMRREIRRDQTWERLLDAIRMRRRERWVVSLLQETWAFYGSIRHRAAPAPPTQCCSAPAASTSPGG